MSLETFQSTNIQIQFETSDFSSFITQVTNRARNILPLCETDLATHCRWFGVDPASTFGAANRVVVTFTDVHGGSNTGFSKSHPQMDVNPEVDPKTGVGSDDFVAGIFAEEMIEILMSLKGGWNAGLSDGEGLSRVAGVLQHPNAGLANDINTWIAHDPTMDSTATVADDAFRKDWVSNNFTGSERKDGSFFVSGDQDSYSIGCSMLFIMYLRDQLGFTMTEICQNGQGTLAGTYLALTGASGAFSRFKSLIDFNFPSSTMGTSAPSPFPLFLLHTGTPLATSDGANGDFAMAPSAQRDTADLYFVKRRNTGTGRIELHALSGASRYQDFILHTGTALAGAEDANGVFLLGTPSGAHAPDLYYVKTRNTGSGHVEVHIVSAASSYQDYSVHSPTALLEADGSNGVFALADVDGNGRPDLVFIKTANTGSGQVEVHVMSAASNFGAFLIQTPTAVTESDAANGDFALSGPAGAANLYFIKRRNTGTGKIEVHVLSGQSKFGQFTVHIPSLISEADDPNGAFLLGDYDGDAAADLVFIKTRNAGSNSIEVHVAPIPRSTDTN